MIQRVIPMRHLHFTEKLRRRAREVSIGFCLWHVFSVALAQTSPKVQDDLRKELEAAGSYYTHHQYPKAETALRKLLSRAPKSYAANELLGLALVAQGRDSEATPFFEQAVRASPGSIPGRENLAANYVKKNDTPLAEKEFKALVKLDPKNFDLQHNLGEFYISQDAIANAVVPLKAAQALKPADYSNGYDLSLAEMMSGDLPAAQEQIKALLKVKDTAELHSMLAEIYEKQNNSLLAGQEFQRAIQIEPTEDGVYDWGTELLRHQNFKEASQVYESGIKLYPQSWRMHAGFGVSESLRGNNQNAVTSLLYALDLNPTDPRSYFFLSMLDSIPAAQVPEVAARFEKYALAFPDRAQAQLYYANNLWKDDEVTSQRTAQSEKIETLLKTAASLDPTLAEAHLQLGILYARREEYPAAATEFEAAIKSRPTLAVAHYRFSQTLNRLGQKDRAKEEVAEYRRLTTAQTMPHVVSAFLLTDEDSSK